MIRIKFRCLSITQRLTSTTVDLKPVIAKTPTYPGGSEENQKFWTATPHGDATFIYQGAPSDTPFVVGSYYYFDIEEAAPGGRPWVMAKVSECPSQLIVEMSLKWLDGEPVASASILLSIENREAWPTFKGKPGTTWWVTVLDAMSPDAGSLTYP